MHVKPLRSELCVDLSGFGAPPRAVNAGGRRPLSAIAGNTLRGRDARPPPLSLCPAKDDPAAFLDMCAVIKPGHVREKIALFAPDPAPSARAGKVKSSRRENGDAKRRRRSAGHKNLRRDPGNGPPTGASDRSSTEGAEHKVSVGAMVAFLERRRSARRARMPPLPEDLESVRVSDVVAKLECLQRRDGGGAFTRPRRWVGRLLLTAGPAPSPPPSPYADARHDDPTERSRRPPAGGAAAPETPPSPGETEPPPGLLFLSAPSPPSPSYESGAERAEAADDFAGMRRRLRELLEPPVALVTLPQDVLVGVFALLPTRTLAALKCTCRYFKSVIENYGVRPADSLWVSDPRYREDPCKKCKRRYGRGDVSPCRWHHKPYCQALPFGPGFWLCCHRRRRDAPGCNVGLHDNRWVPAGCAVGVAVCRRSADD